MSETYQQYAIAIIGFTVFILWLIVGTIVLTEIAIFISRIKCIFCPSKKYPTTKNKV
jgi:hypothetical protein